MESEKAKMGVLIIDKIPSEESKMWETAEKIGEWEYFQLPGAVPVKYARVQIVTTDDIFDGEAMQCPPSMHAVMTFRKERQQIMRDESGNSK